MNAHESQDAADLSIVRDRILEARDAADIALAKAGGIVLVLSQVRKPEMESELENGNALWAVRDFIREAHEAVREAENLRARRDFLTTPASLRLNALREIHDDAIRENRRMDERDE